MARRAFAVIPTFLAVVLLGPVIAGQGSLQLRVLSNRPDMLSGGNALVRVEVPADVSPASVQVMLNGADVTSMLRADERSRTLTGVVKGLANGANVLAAAGGGVNTRLTLLNHPITGPVFSGPHEQPFICDTERFKLRSGGTLGAPRDGNCSIATRVDYYYRASAGGDLKPLPNLTAPPADVAMATVLGQQVPYIVRIETGTINRAIYQIAMLHNPAREVTPDVATQSAGWNGRLVYTFGGGCAGGWYRQGASTGGIEDDVILRQGYAVASASLNVFGNNCSELLAAETMMMVKEHFIETYGVPRFTIGWGTSGGSYQQYQIADNYPGLLDGLMTGRSFPDLVSGTVPYVSDARLLETYFAKRASVAYTGEQKRRITGFGVLATMSAESLNPGRIHVTEFCPEVLPQALRYDPVKNPKGARCDVFDHAVNTYGRDPKTGFVRRPLDNVGVQYGLAALNDGTITKEQFLDLNEKIGGYDADGNVAPARTVGDVEAMRAAYRSGRLTHGRGMATTPIIDYRTYYDDTPAGDVHVRYHSFSTRARLMKANGHLDNHVLLVEDRKYGGFSTRSPVLREALTQMDRWLTTLSEDTSNDAAIVKLRRAKPADLVDACWTPGENPQKIVEPQVYGSGRCEMLYPANSFPRGVAGSPIAADVLKCQLTPVDAKDYKVAFTEQEMGRLKSIFPGGVCDWTKAGVEQQPAAGSWQRFNPPPGQAGTR